MIIQIQLLSPDESPSLSSHFWVLKSRVRYKEEAIHYQIYDVCQYDSSFQRPFVLRTSS